MNFVGRQLALPAEPRPGAAEKRNYMPRLIRAHLERFRPVGFEQLRRGIASGCGSGFIIRRRGGRRAAQPTGPIGQQLTEMARFARLIDDEPAMNLVGQLLNRSLRWSRRP